METNKACLVFVPELAELAGTIAAWLEAEGASICTVEIALSQLELIKNGNYDQNAAVRSCVDGASVCIFLLGDSTTGAVNSVADIVATSTERVVVVAGPGAKVPQVFDDTADALVSAESAELRDVILGKNVWQQPDGSAAPRRVPVRVKCQ